MDLRVSLYYRMLTVEYLGMAEISLLNVSKSYGDQVALDDVTMTVPDGSFVVLLGPTGAGKTTTLRLISGLDKPDSGQILINGEDAAKLTPAQRNMAMVFQQYSLYPHLTVRQNLAFPLKSPMLRTPEDEIVRKVADVSEVLQISHKLDNKATELSGGEMQRVSIGRALVRNPQLFLMDEPLSSLDAKLRSDLRIELKRIQANVGSTMLYVTHDQVEAMTMATHVGVLDQGKLVQFGSPREIYENPISIYAASRLGSPKINILQADVFSGAPDKAVSIGLRPEHISLGEGIESEVTKVEYLGDQTRLHLSIDNQKIITLTNTNTRLIMGDKISISPKNPLYFDANGVRI